MAKFKIKKKDCLLTVRLGMLEPKQILVFSYMVKMENLNLNSELVQKLKPPRLSWKAH